MEGSMCQQGDDGGGGTHDSEIIRKWHGQKKRGIKY